MNELLSDLATDLVVKDYGKTVGAFTNYISQIDGNCYPSLNLSNRTAEWLETRVLAALEQEYTMLRLELRGRLPELIDKKYTVLKEMAQSKLENSYYAQRSNISQVVQLCLPNYDQDHSGFMVIWFDSKGRSSGRDGRIMMRSGKAIRRMFPILSDKTIENINDEYRHKFSCTSFTLKVSVEASDFKHAYQHRMSPVENPRTTNHRKNLGNSCLRHNFTDRQSFSRHPAEAYASGEFQIVWVEDNDKLIAARCVVWMNPWGKPISAPAYGTTDAALDLVEGHLRDIKANRAHPFQDEYDWEGAKLVRIDKCEGEYIGPYTDVMPQAVSKEVIAGKETAFLIVQKGGEIPTSTYQGILYDSTNTKCCECDAIIPESEEYYCHDSIYCECCGPNMTFSCDQCDELEYNHERNEVLTTGRYNNTRTLEYCDTCFMHNCVTTVQGEYWLVEVCVTTYGGGHISPIDYENDYFTSDWDSEVYPNSFRVETSEGESVALDEVLADSDYELNKKTNIWHKRDIADDCNETITSTAEVANV